MAPRALLEPGTAAWIRVTNVINSHDPRLVTLERPSSTLPHTIALTEYRLVDNHEGYETAPVRGGMTPRVRGSG